MKGRPPTPSSVRNLTGIDKRKKDTIGKKKPKTSSLRTLPKPPKTLEKPGAEFWKTIGKACLNVGVLTEPDLTALELTCRCWDRLENARDQLGNKLLESGQFGQKKHVLLLIVQQEEEKLLKYLVQFGLTPVARERITSEGPGADDPFSEFFDS
jgi:P27 family predicted phage terminase small subunit